MDPLSIAASIAGLVALTASIITNGCSLLSRVKKNSTEIGALWKEVACLTGILHTVKAKLDEAKLDEVKPIPWLPKDQEAKWQEAKWQENMIECNKTLEDTEGLMESLASSNIVGLVVKGKSLSDRVERQVAKIERFKSLFTLCLQLLNKFVGTASTPTRRDANAMCY